MPSSHGTLRTQLAVSEWAHTSTFIADSWLLMAERSLAAPTRPTLEITHTHVMQFVLDCRGVHSGACMSQPHNSRPLAASERKTNRTTQPPLGNWPPAEEPPLSQVCVELVPVCCSACKATHRQTPSRAAASCSNTQTHTPCRIAAHTTHMPTPIAQASRRCVSHRTTPAKNPT